VRLKAQHVRIIEYSSLSLQSGRLGADGPVTQTKVYVYKYAQELVLADLKEMIA
jgi:hypothetical protein